MTSPARRHFEQETARLAAQAEGGVDLETLSVYQRLLKNLYADKAIIKNLRGIADKAKAKAEMLPAYAEWVQGVLAGDTVQADDRITPTVLIWTIDAGLLDDAMPLAEFAIQHNMPSTDEFQREMPELLVEQYAEQISEGYAISGEHLKKLVAWATEKDGELHRHNINDNVRAKLLKAAGEWAEENSLPDYALHLYEKAVAYSPRIGVKKRIDVLSKAKG